MAERVTGKRRTRQHTIADLAVNHLERFVLRCGHTIERVLHDYGYDGIMTTFNDAGEVEPGNVFFQVKATDRLPLLKSENSISWPVDRSDLKLWLHEGYPVVLVVYDGMKDRASGWTFTSTFLIIRRHVYLFQGKRST